VKALSQGTAEFGPNVNDGGEAAKGEAARRCIFWSEIWTHTFNHSWAYLAAL
jgi:hypothetical protein